MKDTVMGVILGAVAVVLASWYLTRTRGALLPFPGAFSVTGDGAASSGAGNCAGSYHRGYQATGVRAPSAPPATWGAFQ